MPIVKAVCISEQTGTPKQNIGKSEITSMGLKDDAHAGEWHRQVSLLAEESIDKMRALGVHASYGNFAENITTEGLVLYELPIGTILQINDVVLEVTQIGKECHTGCAIQKLTGKCIMPKEGIFTRVIQPGTIGTW